MATIKLGMKQGLQHQIRVQREGDFKEKLYERCVSKKDKLNFRIITREIEMSLDFMV
jgi:hypothetical protein